MNFEGFVQDDFDIFHIEGLDDRMEAIQTRIQPKFREIGTYLSDHLSMKLGNEVFLHIAKHARRTVNPPQDTWLAIADNKRGYKKHPHFQVGLFDDHVFIWVAFIYELDFKKEIAESFINSFNEIKQLPDYYKVSLDHMKKESITIAELEMKHMERFRDVKKAEFLIGQHLPAGDIRLTDSKSFIKTAEQTIDTLIPFYQQALSVRS